jgi:ketose-bisphosphate aldolase
MKTLDVLKNAKANKFALGAFNAANAETIKVICNTAARLKAPVIIEASDGEVNFIGIKQIAALVKTYKESIHIPIILNLDHGKDLETCTKAIEAGFDYIHFDGSALPLNENIRITKEVVRRAHEAGVPVEGEMDHIQGSSANHMSEKTEDIQDPNLYTNPRNAKEFVEETGIDVFASFIGNLHGLYANRKHIQIEILKELEEALPNTLFSLHGGSGIYDDDIREAVKHGIVKININSELRIAFKLTLQKALNASNEVAIYKLMEDPLREIEKVVEAKMNLFGCVGKATNFMGDK